MCYKIILTTLRKSAIYFKTRIIVLDSGNESEILKLSTSHTAVTSALECRDHSGEVYWYRGFVFYFGSKIWVCYTRTKKFSCWISYCFLHVGRLFTYGTRSFERLHILCVVSRKPTSVEPVEGRSDRFPREFYANQRDMHLWKLTFLTQRCVGR
jgi:hypothetical protein